MPRGKKATEENTEVKNQEQETTTPPSPAPKKKVQKKIDPNMLVEVMNNSKSTVVFVNKRTQAEWVLEGYGAFDTMTVADLTNMKSSAKSLLNDGYLLILDDDVIEYLRLEKLYENILKPEDIDNFFEQNDQTMKDMLEKMPLAMKELLYREARERHLNNHPSMDYNSKRKVFEDHFGVKFDNNL